MSSTNFVHLHNHTEYSFLDGAIKIPDMIAKAKEYGMPALAITDHGGLFGAVEFYNKCMAAGIKPVIGFEAYMAPGSRLGRTRGGSGEKAYHHLILLARNNQGYKNLMRLSGAGYLEGFYYKPRIDAQLLREHAEGLIGTSACVAGAIPRALLDGNRERAKQLTEEYLQIFGEGNFYFELQDHGLEDEKQAFAAMIDLGKEMGVPFIVANDAHYLQSQDAPSHEVLLCIQTQTTLDDTSRFKFNTDQVYFKSPQEMAELFPQVPEAMSNTVEIAERCNVEIHAKPQLPKLAVPQGFKNEAEYLGHLAHRGLRDKYSHVTPGLEERLDYELGVICKMGYEGYFLAVRDFVNYATSVGIMTGCRGSAAGSLVAYTTGITHVDPIRFELIFERFLNPERVSLPDADIDFPDRERGVIIDYVIDKYGRESVCQIINFGRMKAKMVVKDVARVLGVAPADAQKLSNMVTEKNLKLSLQNNGELARAIEENETYQQIVKHGMVLEGLARQAGMHAAGVIIAPGDVQDWAPLFKQPNTEIVMTQYDMNYVEEVGLIKMDFLGLRTLTVLQDALRLVEENHGKKIELWGLPDHDPQTCELFGRGETIGIFQFESQGMQDNLRKLKPDGVDDLIAMNALYRPGPMDDIPTYIHRKHGREEPEYFDAMLEEILDTTYGVITYQEQVMQVAQKMGGFTMGQADLLRRAMGKKKVAVMEEMGAKFLEGAKKRGVDSRVAKEVFDRMAKFAGYGFNKAHATVYAHVAYQSGYLKAHYPVEFMCANLTSELSDHDRLVIIRNETNRMGIPILPPDVNSSRIECSTDNGSIRLGLGAIKNVGKGAEAVLEARGKKGPFESIFDLCRRTDLRLINKKCLESLICAGALDSLPGTRAQAFATIDKALDYGQSIQKERALGQTNLFDNGGDDGQGENMIPEPQLPQVPPWQYNELLAREKEVLNFYVSGHPLERFRDEIEGFTTFTLRPENLDKAQPNQNATVGGIITTVKTITDKAGRMMAFCALEDFEGSIEVVVFGDAYEKFKHLLTTDVMVLLHGKIDRREEDRKPKLLLDNAMPLSESREKLAKSLHLKIATVGLESDFIEDIRNECRTKEGTCTLIIHLETQESNQYRVRSKRFKVSPNPETLSALRNKLGKGNVWLGKTAA